MLHQNHSSWQSLSEDRDWPLTSLTRRFIFSTCCSLSITSCLSAPTASSSLPSRSVSSVILADWVISVWRRRRCVVSKSWWQMGNATEVVKHFHLLYNNWVVLQARLEYWRNVVESPKKRSERRYLCLWCWYTCKVIFNSIVKRLSSLGRFTSQETQASFNFEYKAYRQISTQPLSLQTYHSLFHKATGTMNTTITSCSQGKLPLSLITDQSKDKCDSMVRAYRALCMYSVYTLLLDQTNTNAAAYKLLTSLKQCKRYMVKGTRGKTEKETRIYRNMSQCWPKDFHAWHTRRGERWYVSSPYLLCFLKVNHKALFLLTSLI